MHFHQIYMTKIFGTAAVMIFFAVFFTVGGMTYFAIVAWLARRRDKRLQTDVQGR